VAGKPWGIHGERSRAEFGGLENPDSWRNAKRQMPGGPPAESVGLSAFPELDGPATTGRRGTKRRFQVPPFDAG